MATIPRAALTRYRQALDRACANAGQRATRALRAWADAHPTASVAELRNAAIRITASVLGDGGDTSAALACQLFDDVMGLERVAVDAALPYAEVRTEAVEATVRRVVGDVDGSQASVDGFIDRVGQLAEREVRLMANATVERNVERASSTRAGRGVRYARVPSNSDPCAWCAMLASRGFVYSSAETAGAGSHHHCTCTVVPGVQGRTKVDGYDPGYYMGVWAAKR